MAVEQIPPTVDNLAEKPQKVAIDLASVLKAVRTGDLERVVKPIHDAARARLRTRGMRRAGHAMDAAKASATTPKSGSDNINLRGVLNWINDVKVDDAEDVDKLQQVWATCAERLK